MKFISSPEGSKIPHELGTWTSPCPKVWEETGAAQDEILGWVLKQADLPTELPGIMERKPGARPIEVNIRQETQEARREARRDTQ